MADYINAPIDTDSDQLQEAAFAYIQTRWPDWDPDEGNLESWLIAACARIVAEARDTASDVPRAIFRYYGEKVVNVPPVDATSAVVSSTWTVTSNPVGRTIEAGTMVSIIDSNDEPVIFEVAADVVLAAGVMTTGVGAVLLHSQEEGAHTTGLGVAGLVVPLLDSPSWVGTATLTGSSSGGVDAEDDDTYLGRLATRLSLLTPRPILPADHALLATDIAARNGFLARAIGLDLTVPGRNQINILDFSGTISGGTYTLTVDGQTTAAINWNDSNATIQTKLEALSNVAPGDVTLSGGPSPADVTIEHTGSFRNTTRSVTRTSSLTGGGTMTVTTPQAGAADQTNVERAVTVGIMDFTTGADLPDWLMSVIKTELEDLREVNFIVSLLKPVRPQIDVTFVGTARPGKDAALVQANAILAVQEYLTSTRWGVSETDGERSWNNEVIVRHQAISKVLQNVADFDHWTSLTIGIHGGSMGTADIDLSTYGLLPLPSYGTVSGTVT